MVNKSYTLALIIFSRIHEYIKFNEMMPYLLILQLQE